MKTVSNYRGLKVHIVEANEVPPSWVADEIARGESLLAQGHFPTPSFLARLLDRYIDEELNTEDERKTATSGLPAPRTFGRTFTPRP